MTLNREMMGKVHQVVVQVSRMTVIQIRRVLVMKATTVRMMMLKVLKKNLWRER